MHQQVILGQEAGEQHPVPVLVGKFLGELVDLLAIVGIAPITGLVPPGSKLLAKRSVSQREVAERFGGIDGPPLECARAAVSVSRGPGRPRFPIVAEDQKQVEALPGPPIRNGRAR